MAAVPEVEQEGASKLSMAFNNIFSDHLPIFVDVEFKQPAPAPTPTSPANTEVLSKEEGEDRHTSAPVDGSNERTNEQLAYSPGSPPPQQRVHPSNSSDDGSGRSEGYEADYF